MKPIRKSGLLISAPGSGAGKTLITSALLRELKSRGLDISAAKAGPDYIDPGFHQNACWVASVNLDAWAMNADRLNALAINQPGDHLLVEGAMGLFDGASDGSGSAAELSKVLGIPVLLVVNAAKQSHSVAALVKGFRDHDPEVLLGGVILNQVGSPRHERLLRGALSEAGISVLGAIPRDPRLEMPERHLGLVQAQEIGKIEEFIATATGIVSDACDMDAIESAFEGMDPGTQKSGSLPPLGQRIAIAQDEAFSFIYPHVLSDWRSAGAEVSFFSPLGNEAPGDGVDAIFLPGGYPELHGGRLASAETFRDGMHAAASRGARIYGECGGYMVLGHGLVDAQGGSHKMLGLLELETSFEKRKLHLGYRRLEAVEFPLGEKLTAHEFHYSSIIKAEGDALFSVSDAEGERLGNEGLRRGAVMGSYLHVIDKVVS